MAGEGQVVEFESPANGQLRALTRRILEQVLADCQADFHLRGLRHDALHREFHRAIRLAKDAKMITFQLDSKGWARGRTGL